MKHSRYTFNFYGGQITVEALNAMSAEILAMAEAIRRGWNYTIISREKSKVPRYAVSTTFETDDHNEVMCFAFDCHKKGYNTKFTDRETGETYVDYDPSDFLEDLRLEQGEQM